MHVIPTFLVVPPKAEKESRKERKKWRNYEIEQPPSSQGDFHIQTYIFFWQHSLWIKSSFSCPPPSPRKHCRCPSPHPTPHPPPCQEDFPEVPRCAWLDFTGIYILISYYQAYLEDIRKGMTVLSLLRTGTKVSAAFAFSDSVGFI